MRHNLSLNDCFIKVLKDPNRPWGKDNYWTINEQSGFTSAAVESYKRRRKRLKAENDASSVTTDDSPIIRSRTNSSSDVTESSYDHPTASSASLDITPSCSSRGSTSGATTPNTTPFSKVDDRTTNNYDDIPDNKNFNANVPVKAEHELFFMSSVDKLLEAASIKQCNQIRPSNCIPVQSLSSSISNIACMNMPLSNNGQFTPMNNFNLAHMPQPALGHHHLNAPVIYPPYSILYGTYCPRSQPTDYRYGNLPPYYFPSSVTASNAACGK